MKSHEEYRNNLAAELKEVPKDHRQAVLADAKEMHEYWDARYQKKKTSEWSKMPKFDFDIDEDEDFREKIGLVAEAIYSHFDLRERDGTVRKYDAHQGDMLCGRISEELEAYLQENGIDAKLVERSYEIKNPDGEYDTSFGHVYVTIENGEQTILVDPTYLQFVGE